MKSRAAGWAAMLLASVICTAQTLDNRSLKGKYYFRHLQLGSDAQGNVNDARGLLGAISFDGAGGYSFTAQFTQAMAAAVAQTGSGTYSVDAAGLVALSHPLRSGATINARLGASALVGSTTEISDHVFDLFVAIPAATAAVSTASLSGSYWTALVAFPNASGSSARSAFFNLAANGQGGFGAISVSGHAADQSGGRPATQMVSGATYAFGMDGTGTATFGAASSAAFLSGSKTIYLSQDGTVMLGASTAPGAHDLLIGVKAMSGASNASWKGRFWSAGLRLEPGAVSAYSGSAASPGLGKLTLARRLHAGPLNGAIDLTSFNAYNLAADGSGTAELTRVALGAGGGAYVTSAVDPNDSGAFEIGFGVRMAATSGSGVYLSPQEIVNAASFAPAGNPIAPGEFIALFGSGLARSSQTATPPYPPSLNGVTVLINNRAAPLYFVSPTQINALVPYATPGPKATIVVQNESGRSNAVEVAVAKTAPGVFALDASGTGAGAVLHADFSVVNTDNPARRGETVLVFLTGLGAVNPGIADGTAGGADPLSMAVAPVTVLVGGKAAEVGYAGLAPGFPGLYQLNVKIPLTVPAAASAPLAVQTPEAFHDQVEVALAP